MVVTNVIAKKMIEHGHQVSQVVFKTPNEEAIKLMDSRIHQYVVGSLNYTSHNRGYFNTIIEKENIDVVINQWGLNIKVGRFVKQALETHNFKVISVYHNQPNKNGHLTNIELALKTNLSIYSRCKYVFMKKCIEIASRFSMRYIYNMSDVFMVLSDSFIPIFKQYVKIKNAPKLVSLPNPLTIYTDVYEFDSSTKKKEIIFVGRLDETQKKIIRILEIWKKTSKLIPDWKLILVGDGSARLQSEIYVRDNKIDNVDFEGFQNPTDYYKRASILILASDFEGFGLVIVEGMAFGVVPVVYNSYAAAADIITQGKDGILVDKSENEEVIVKKMSEALFCLCTDLDKRENMAKNAMVKARSYNVDSIYKKWEYYLKLLKNKKS